MTRWRQGQQVYQSLISEINGYGSLQTNDPYSIPALAKSNVSDFIEKLSVKDVIYIHEYLAHRNQIRPNIKIPVYEYHGGDRIISVTRYVLKNIDSELANSYA